MVFLLALPLIAIVAAGGWLLVRYARLKSVTREIARDPLPALGPAEAVFRARAEHLGTSLPGAQHMRYLAEGYGKLVVGDLDLSGNALAFAGLFVVPLAWVEEASLGRTKYGEPLLRVAWQRAGRRLVTAFALPGEARVAEQWRKEIALRAGRAPPLPFLIGLGAPGSPPATGQSPARLVLPGLAPPVAPDAASMRVAHASVEVTDVDAALAFYVGVLGFSLRRRGEGTGGGELAFLVAPGGGELQLRRGSPDLAHAAALNVDDVDALLVRTKAVRGPYTLPSGSRVAFVADPDGNRLELVQKPAAPLPRLTFLGTGDAFGTGGRAQSATLLEDYAGALLVDCGGNALAALLAHGADPSRLDAIVVTHLHGDHFAGLPFVLMHQGVIARRTRPLVIAGPPGTSERLAALREALYAGSTKKPLFPLEHVELAPGEVMVAGRAVRCFPARHMSAPHKAFSLRIGGAAFSGDTALSPALADCARGADVLVVECSSAEPLEDHLSWRELAGVLPLGARRVVVNHVGPGVAERRAELEASGVTLAEDGLVVSLSVT